MLLSKQAQTMYFEKMKEEVKFHWVDKNVLKKTSETDFIGFDWKPTEKISLVEKTQELMEELSDNMSFESEEALDLSVFSQKTIDAKAINGNFL